MNDMKNKIKAKTNQKQMEIVPNDSSLFKASVEALKEFLPQVQLRISDEGVRINGMDVSHVGFVDFFLSKEDCAVLKVPTTCVIGVNSALLSKTLNSVGSGDRVTLGLKQDKLVVSYKNEKIGKRASYEIATLDISEDILHLPELTYDAAVSAKTSDVLGIIKEVGCFGDTMKLRLDEDGFQVSAEGDGGLANQSLENTDDRDMTLGQDFMEASFGTKYLTTIMKSGAPLSSTTKLEFDGTSPLRASFLFGKESRFMAYLAPKMVD
jgi:proliferating cell nuclear antigen PCNA